MAGIHYIAAIVSMAAILFVYNPFKTYLPSVATENLLDSYDYVIVGAGSAGSVLASRLSEDPDVTVLLLEAGGDYTENEDFHIPAMFNALFETGADWGYRTVQQKHSMFGMNGRSNYLPRGKVLGGSSVLNAMAYVRGSRHDYDAWQQLGCDGWGYDDVLPYFIKSEDIMMDELKDSKYHGHGGPLAVSSGSKTRLRDHYLQAGRELGYQYTDHNGENQEGFFEGQLTVRKGVRSSTGLEFLGRAVGRTNLHVGIRSFVTKVEITDKAARGVFFIREGRKKFVSARKEVILSGGAINSPQLLMLSGVGPEEHLRELGIPLVQDLPVGRNLQDHLQLFMLSNTNVSHSITPDDRESLATKLQYHLFGDGVLATAGQDVVGFVCTYDNKSDDCAADIQLSMFSFVLVDNVLDLKEDIAGEYFNKSLGHNGFTLGLYLLHPKSVGSLTLKTSDPFDYPVIDPGYLSDNRDVESYIRGIRVWERFIATPAMQRLGASMKRMDLSFCSAHSFQTDAYWECIVRHLSSTENHQCGTCKMGGAKDKTAVVDSKLRVRGVQNLRVVDASIMPFVVSGNINAAVIMIAEKAVDIIRHTQ